MPCHHPNKVFLMAKFKKIQLRRQEGHAINMGEQQNNQISVMYSRLEFPTPSYISNYTAHSNACKAISQFAVLRQLKFPCVSDSIDILNLFQIISCPPCFCSCSCSSCSFYHRDSCFDSCHSSCSLIPCSWIFSYLCCGTSSCLSFS